MVLQKEEFEFLCLDLESSSSRRACLYMCNIKLSSLLINNLKLFINQALIYYDLRFWIYLLTHFCCFFSVLFVFSVNVGEERHTNNVITHDDENFGTLTQQIPVSECDRFSWRDGKFADRISRWFVVWIQNTIETWSWGRQNILTFHHLVTKWETIEYKNLSFL